MRSLQSNLQFLDSKLQESLLVQQDQQEENALLKEKLKAKELEGDELRLELEQQNATTQIIKNSFAEAEDRFTKAEAQWQQRLLELEQQMEEKQSLSEEENQEEGEHQTSLRSWGSMVDLSQECNEMEEDQEEPPLPIVSQPDSCRTSTVPSPMGTSEAALVDLPLPPLVPLPTVSSLPTGMNERSTDSVVHLPVLGSRPINTSRPSPVISQSQHGISSNRGKTTNHVQTTRKPPKSEFPVFYPKSHPHSQNKLLEWDLKVTKGTLIIGDSNLARLPCFYDPNIQVDSYPGATFLHAQTLLDKCTVHSEVETIILSFGVNNRTKRLAATLQQLEATVRAAQRRFPKAVIKIPLINFSDDLPYPQKQILRRINTYLTDMPIDTIPLLEDFSTCPDKIHWTPRTGKKMWAHWMTSLNN